MDLENENSKSNDYSNGSIKVKELQSNLFPLFPRMSGFYSTYLLPSTSHEISENDENSTIQLKLVGSKDLFAINRESNFQIQPARWPTECQVIPEPIEHIVGNVSQPDPYYIPTGLEMQPKPSGEEYGIIVYQYNPISAVNYFSRSSVGGSKYLLSTNICPEENSLKFESRFESGNLEKAIRLTPNYYELYLRSDLYTSRYMQWFYFRVTNMKKHFLYRFSIVNFTKEGSLYNSGLRPLMYSEKDSRLHSIGWKRCGDQITYFSNDNQGENTEDTQTTYTLTFTVIFPHDDDTVYFASCYPYTYTNLQNYLWDLSTHPVKNTFTTIRLLCKSLAGNNVDYITITSPVDEEENKKKRAIVITGRVHPGETPSSWMMKGIIDFLTSDTAPAKELRDKFIFKIVPMLNPDGVVVGNNRCSLTGKDLNRQYRTVMRESYPSIWYTKLMVRRLIEECGVSMYCDLHGHSRKHNIFVYGCENRKTTEKHLQEQIFPLMLHKNASEKFSFEDCSFRVQKGKEGTGRIVMWMMGITNSYTLEASFAGSSMGSRTATHFSIQDYEQMGKSFCQTLLDFYDEEPKKVDLMLELQQLDKECNPNRDFVQILKKDKSVPDKVKRLLNREKLRTKILNRLNEGGSCAGEPTNIQLSDYSSDDGSSTDSDENEGGNDKILVPPSSPNVNQPIMKNSESQVEVKSRKSRRAKHTTSKTFTNSATRKIAPVRKNNLLLMLEDENRKMKLSGSSSESETENKKVLGRKKSTKIKKPSSRKKNQQQQIEENEVPIRKNLETQSVSTFELNPPEDLNINLKKKKAPPLRLYTEKRNGLDVVDQLQLVQQKLLALKHKIWYGSGDGDQPLSWGSIMVGEVEQKNSATATNAIKNSPMKKVKKKLRKKKSPSNQKVKPEGKRKPLAKKSLNSNLKRQHAIDLIVPTETIMVRKSQSFNNLHSTSTLKKLPKFKNYASCDDKETKVLTVTLPTNEKVKKKKFKSSKKSMKRSFA